MPRHTPIEPSLLQRLQGIVGLAKNARSLRSAIREGEVGQLQQVLDDNPTLINTSAPFTHEGASAVWLTPLEYALGHRPNPNIVALLLDKGASITPLSIGLAAAGARAAYTEISGQEPISSDLLEEQRTGRAGALKVLELLSAFGADWEQGLSFRYNGFFTRIIPAYEVLVRTIGEEAAAGVGIKPPEPVTIAEDVLARRRAATGP